MERSLALMCGAGALPARMAGEARRQGWRVVAFTFGDAPGVADGADLIIPSRFTEVAPVLAALQTQRISAALFSGKFWMEDVVKAEAREGDAAAVDLAARARSRADRRLAEVVVTTLEGLGVTVLDQRRFVGDWLAGPETCSRRAPTDEEWSDVQRGLGVARLLADAGIGQTVVVRHGAVTALEALEGTTETIRRGTALAGPGAVVVKTVARDHDYRFDLPALGVETVEAARRGGASVIAFEAGRVLLLERAATIDRADEAGIALVAVQARDDG